MEDNRDSADSLAILLKVTGHEVRIAHDGLEAVEVTATFQPQVDFAALTKLLAESARAD